MTKLEIYQLEQQNDGKVYLFREGMFYKAYERSAYLLCTRVQPFKVSARPLKGLNEPLISVGFPMASLEKFSAGMNREGGVLGQESSLVLQMSSLPDLSGFPAWKASFPLTQVQGKQQPRFNGLPVYGIAYRLVLEITTLCAGLDRRFRYSLGEDLRNKAKQTLLCIMWAGKGENRLDNITHARHALTEVQLCLRLLNDMKVVTDKRYVPFMELTQEVSGQLSKWERHCCQNSPPEYRHLE
jgi:hypothetical protein